jgi:PPOX class probable F420-dependent enzyme
MSSRDRITMSEAERQAFLEEETTVIVATSGPRGWPHMMPLWFVPRGEEIWITTYGKSQKIRNLERDPRASLMVEAGEEYGKLRGVMIEAEAEIRPDDDEVLALMRELQGRFSAVLDTSPEVQAAREAQARKRVAVRFKPVHVASWDHRKF